MQPIEPPWLISARRELGVKEIPGPGDHPRIVEYLQTVDTLPANLQGNDETAWCSAFVGWNMETQGFPSTEKANARSWLNWGVNLPEPAHGCVCVLWRNDPLSWKGHVGLLVGLESKSVMLLGGNQGNAVTIQRYPLDRVLGYRWSEHQQWKGSTI